MGRLRYLNPFKIRSLVRDLRRARSGGGPKLVRLVRLGEPRGLIVPAAEVEFEIEALDGSVNRFQTAVPVPWPAAWTYRLARRLGVPLVSAIDHDKLGFDLPFPRFGRQAPSGGSKTASMAE
ncbi:MAG: hypothetical protein M3383_05490 [Actinomycetota bacterium]|nr:hypothetical protein [Actinomycetota bacterium]